MNDAGAEQDGWVLVRRRARGGGRRRCRHPGRTSASTSAARSSRPGLVNTHHHLSQTLTRARAQEAICSTGCASSIRCGRGSTPRPSTRPRGRAWPSWRCPAARPSSTTTTSSRGAATGSEAEMEAARELGVRFVASRGSMDLGESRAGCRPTRSSRDRRGARRDGAAAGAPRPRRDDAARGGAVLAVLGDEGADAESAALARRLGLRLHTHLAETVEEDAYCRELYGCRPVEYLERLGWSAGRLVRPLRPPLRGGRRARSAGPGTASAHCPTSNMRLGAGVAPVRELVDAGRRSGSASTARPRTSAATSSRGEAGAAGRARPRRPAGDDGARGAAARHARRRGVLGRDDIG